ncbi:MAG: hypothetical protein Q7S45_04855 [Candidatus Curtissbacteria bacterium]|nr:hypothetical protein [Candidatus Curtissbacteria bacterium]
MLDNILRFIFSLAIGVVVYWFALHYAPKGIKIPILQLFANRAYSKSIKRLESFIDEKEDKDVRKNLVEAKFGAQQTRENFVKLSERLKHDTKKLFEVTTDWRDYTKNLDEWVTGFEWSGLGVDINYDEIRNWSIRMEEIEKRYESLLKK